MAGRVNTKFVIVLTVLLAVLGLGLAAFMVLQARRDPGRYIARAEKLMSEGDYKTAAAQFGRAYSYEDNNASRVKILLSRADALQQVEAQSTREARELMQSIIACWQTAVNLEPANVEASEHLLDHQYEQAESAGVYINLWNNLYLSADQLLKYDPDNQAAKRYRGIAQIRRIEQLNLGEQALEDALADLRESLENQPGDVDVIYQMAMGKLVGAAAAERVAEQEKAKALRAEAHQLMDQLAENQPDNVDAVIARFQFEFREAMRLPGDQRADQVRQAVALLDRAGQLLLEQDHPQQARYVAAQLERFDNERMELEDGRAIRRGLYRSEQLLRHVIRQHPDDVVALVGLGSNLVEQRRFDDALAFFLEAKKDRPVPLTMQGLRAVDARAMAMKEAADLYLTQRQLSRDPEQREELLAKAVKQADELESVIGDQAPYTNLMRGKIALARGDRLEAISLLEKVSAQLEGRNPEVLEQLARAYQQSGQTGAAAQTLERLISSPGGNSQILAHIQLAQLRLQTDDVDGAATLVERVLSVLPNNAEMLVLKSQIESRRMLEQNPGDREAAVKAGLAVLEQADDADNRTLVLQKAGLHQQGGDIATARATLEAYLADHPEDLNVLQQVVRYDTALDETDKAVARVEKAIEAQPDNDVLKLMLSSLTGGEGIGEQVENIIAQQDDPLEKQLAYYRYYLQSNQADKAEQALAEAVEMAPDDARVLAIQFDRALNQEDFAAAQKVVDRAKAMNDGQGIDFAGGAFWEGRLLMAKRQYLEAAETLDRGLKQMPTNSAAQVLLGRALMMVGDANGAERALRRALDLKPDDVSAWLLMHSIHDRRGQHGEALADLERAMRFGGSGNQDVFNQYVNYLGQHGDTERAIQIRQRIAQTRPDDDGNRRALAQLYLNAEQPDQAKQVLDDLLADNPDSLANVALMAVYHASQNDYDTGRQMILTFLQDLQEQDKATGSDWVTYARYLRAGGQTEDALAAYRKAIENEDSQQKPFTREMADWLFTMNRFDDAAAEYQRLLGSARMDDPQGKLLIWRRYVETLLNAGRDAEAERQLAALLKDHPADSQSLLIRALTLRKKLASDDLSAAERQRISEQVELALDQSVAYSRNQAMPYIQRARYRFGGSDPRIQQLVFEDLRKAIELEPSSIAPREMTAEWHLRRGDVDAAISELRRLITTRPNYPQARAKLAELYLTQPNRMVELEQLLSESEKLMPNLPAWNQYRARMYQVQGRLPQAEAALAKAYEMDSQSPGRLGEYASLLVRLGKFDRALEVLADQPQAVSRTPALLAVKARALAGAERTDESTAAFNKALDLAGENVGQLNTVITQLQPAMNLQQQLALLSPRVEDDATGAIGLIVARLKLQHDQTDQAIEELEDLAGRFQPKGGLETERHRLLARAYYSKGRLNDARNSYEKVLAGEPTDLMALNNLAYLLADDLDEPAAALPLAQRAVEAVGNSATQRANVLDTLGWVQFRNGDARSAEETLKLSVGLNPMVANHLHLAKVYAATQRSTQARSELITARELAEKQKDNDALKQIDALLDELPTTAANAER